MDHSGLTTVSPKCAGRSNLVGGNDDKFDIGILTGTSM